jgi:dihydrofolate reductase
MISLVVAASINNAIGKNNQLLWHLPNDLKFFKNTTWGSVVIMGRKTFESVNKPLPGRINIVITRQPDWIAEGVKVAQNLDHALQLAKETNCKELFVIGGGEIYNLALPLADRVYLTRVNTNIEGDTFFPELNENEWLLSTSTHFEADEKNAFAHCFEVWDRKRFDS